MIAAALWSPGVRLGDSLVSVSVRSKNAFRNLPLRMSTMLCLLLALTSYGGLLSELWDSSNHSCYSMLMIQVPYK